MTTGWEIPDALTLFVLYLQVELLIHAPAVRQQVIKLTYTVFLNMRTGH